MTGEDRAVAPARALPPARPGQLGRLAVIGALCALLLAGLAVLVVARGTAQIPGDRFAQEWSLHHRPGSLAAAARGLTATGTGIWPYALAVVAGMVVGRGVRGRLTIAAGAIAFLVCGQGARYGLMKLIARPRPPVADWAGHASGFAFPSGHATTSAITAGLLAWALCQRTGRARARFGAVVIGCWALAVGLTRIYLSVHWASDVLAGWLFAGAWLSAGRTAIVAYRARAGSPGSAGEPDDAPRPRSH